MFYNKVCETSVRQVKRALGSCHGRADDLLLQKVIQGMSVIGGVSDHDKESVLQGKYGKEASHKLVSAKARSDIECNVTHSTGTGSRSTSTTTSRGPAPTWASRWPTWWSSLTGPRSLTPRNTSEPMWYHRVHESKLIGFSYSFYCIFPPCTLIEITI
jgi:hypothetical protein